MSFKTIVLPLSIFRNSCKHDAISEAERITITLVQFADAARTVMVFRVINKQDIMSLRALAAAEVSRCFLKIEDIEKLDASLVPEAVVPDIRRVFSEDLKISAYSRYLYSKSCCVGCAAVHIANSW